MGNNYTIEMSVSACNVLDKDVFSKSDPYCVLQVSNSEDRLEDSFQSETIRNTLNPEWKTPFLVDSYLEDDRRIRFTIYDADGKNFKGKEKRDYLGHADLHLQNLFKGTKKYCELDLYDQRNSLIENSKIKIKYEKISNCKDELKIEIRGEKLSKKGFFKVQHPFLEFYRVREDGSLFLAHKTENAKSSQSPEWKIKSLMKRFCNNDENYEMIIKCFDGHGFTPELIGECSMRLKDIGSEEFTFELQHPDKVKKKGNLAKSTGSLIVKSKTIKKKPGFLSYITEENPVYLMVAIDFTSSNGVPSDNFSLHWNSNPNPDELNSYQEVIQKIGNLIAEYKSVNIHFRLQ